jgi:hypothetical protein
VPAKTGVPLMMSGDEVTIGGAMGLLYALPARRLKAPVRLMRAKGQRGPCKVTIIACHYDPGRENSSDINCGGQN